MDCRQIPVPAAVPGVVLPPVRGLRTVRADLSPRDFVLAREPQYWLRNRADGPRRAGVSALGVDGGCCHVVLEEHEESIVATEVVFRLSCGPLARRSPIVTSMRLLMPSSGPTWKEPPVPSLTTTFRPSSSPST